jgi:hypothetical protein
MRTLEAESLTEARREREALIADLASGRAAPRSGVTFAQALADWQGSRTLSERTIRDERAVARRYLSKLLTRRIQDVSVSDAASVLHSNRHLADWTRVHIYRILAGTFAHALRRGLVSRNPMDGIAKAERPRQRNKRNVAGSSPPTSTAWSPQPRPTGTGRRSASPPTPDSASARYAPPLE